MTGPDQSLTRRPSGLLEVDSGASQSPAPIDDTTGPCISFSQFPNELIIQILKEYSASNSREAIGGLLVCRLWLNILLSEVYRNVYIQGVEQFETFMRNVPRDLMSQVINLAFTDIAFQEYEFHGRVMAAMRHFENSPFSRLRGLSIELPVTSDGMIRAQRRPDMPIFTFIRPKCYASQTYPFSVQLSPLSEIKTITHLKIAWRVTETFPHYALRIPSLEKLWICIDPKFWITELRGLSAWLHEVLERGVTILATVKESHFEMHPISLIRTLRHFIEQDKTYPKLLVLYDAKLDGPATLPWDPEASPFERYRDVLNPGSDLTGVFDM
ncbi:hypothetical protein SISNIDRAFT_550640 [Sistotremastrum niveocremeum HHB9708]|uniref:F-box domain-containing protein n=1 Tax=Sistotremastrum niveocremeum HHB9708 TaxID=1314777 RepID=A0A164TAV3_9AGAM|nr:hypothetical protein SISNIDRAFT_550640 [Sistotremastrum niveocremeum HHB9708]